MKLTNESLKELVELSRGPEKLRVCLVGHTGTGKTARVKEIAKQLDMPLHTLLLSQAMPEEVVGLPKVGRDSYKYMIPDWAKKMVAEPGILFLDELDKAREETVGAILTVLWTMELQGVQLHKDSIIIAAQQPMPVDSMLSSQTGQAISARMIFVETETDWGYLEKKHNMVLTDMPSRPILDLPISPIPAPRTVDMVISLLNKAPSEDVRDLILTGTIPEELHDPILNPEEIPITTMDVVTLLNSKIKQPDFKYTDNEYDNPDEPELIDTLREIDLPVLINSAADILMFGHERVFEEVLVIIRTEGTSEDVDSFMNVMRENAVEDDPNTLDTDLNNALSKAPRRAARIILGREGMDLEGKEVEGLKDRQWRWDLPLDGVE